ncbi:MAG: ribonuclease HI family protein [Candidatus Marinimicrobia bacterium]|jgi:ribonuclease HI|nr:ribonuclease HI family protein [Candidatus Neomarinimicrobiota bacterium]MDP6611969.1 ribonuclease HI family protein [Candidatus Neomarinimicrobiota bacterium]|tara:strand:- start:5356 stop:5865 length:510 start_codon:yes stop_codon:yes gene_type:complete
MKLNQQEVKALKELLSDPQNRADETMEQLYQKMASNSEVSLFIDGAADLNSKTAGIGGVILKDGEEVYSFSEYLHDATNNEAEYTALIMGLKLLIDINMLNVKIYSDSELVVKQINNEYKVKNPRMQKLHQQAMAHFRQLDSWTFSHVKRDENAAADRLAKAGRLKKEK